MRTGPGDKFTAYIFREDGDPRERQGGEGAKSPPAPEGEHTPGKGVKWGIGEIGTIGLEINATDLVNGKTQCCRFLRGLVENIQTEVSSYENGKNDRGV